MNNTAMFNSPRMGRVDRIHFIGIGGSGMCGIAEVLHNDGYRISGSDVSDNLAVQRLRSLGVTIYGSHQAAHISNADVVVRSTAVFDDNPEVIAAIEQRIPIIPRAAMLAELMRFRFGIAIAGTHGKTTTTSLVSSIMAEGNLDPSFVIGGKLNSCGSNAQLGKSSYFVAEADESDASFLFLKPMMAVVTNIDADHMGTYGDSLEKLKETFLEFLHHLPFYGLAVLCLEDEGVQSILHLIQRPTMTYGFGETAQYRACNWTQTGLVSKFSVQRPAPHPPLDIQFPWPGRHNVLNALAAIALSTELGVSDAAIQNALLRFEGVGRRFQILGERRFQNGSALIIDDYGHHPQEIISTIEALRKAWPHKRLLHVFQPHRYSRTKALFSQFAQALRLSDSLLLLNVHSAGEPTIEGFDSPHLLMEIRKTPTEARLALNTDLEESLNELVCDGDVILMQGAGSIGQLAQTLMESEMEGV